MNIFVRSRNSKINEVIVAIAAIMTSLLLCSCFTGIEGTSKVKLSREDRKTAEPSAEEMLIADVESTPLGKWQSGKKFYVTDKRLYYALRQRDAASRELSGDTLVYIGTCEQPTPSGVSSLWIVFSDGVTEWEYDTHKRADEALNTVMNTELPMLIDSDYVTQVRNKLKDRKLWIRTSEWYDSGGERVKGKKFEGITVTDVEEGNTMFPLRIEFIFEGDKRYVYMSSGFRSTDSRQFQNLFSLSDVRGNYRNVSDEVWELIREGNVRTGMTKDECRLSLGAPESTQSGRDYSKLLDVWSYGDGKYLKFEDGILVDFRK